MQINHGKSKAMIFNKAGSRDFMPDVHIDDQSLDVVDEVKLLGLVITIDLKWTTNTESICNKGYRRPDFHNLILCLPDYSLQWPFSKSACHFQCIFKFQYNVPAR